MQLLVEIGLKDGVSPEALAGLIEQEEAILYAGTVNETVRQVWWMADRVGGWMLLEMDSLEDAHGFIRRMPAVDAGYVAYEVHPLAPFRGFEALFSPSAKAVLRAELG